MSDTECGGPKTAPQLLRKHIECLTASENFKKEVFSVYLKLYVNRVWMSEYCKREKQRCKCLEYNQTVVSTNKLQTEVNK